MRKSAKKGFAFLALTSILLAAVPALSGDEPSHGWKRSSAGFWTGFPEVRSGFSDNGIALELSLRPGTGVTYSRDGSWASDNAVLQMSTDVIFEGKNEYRTGEARFPASATFVFGKDALSLGTKERITLFFRHLWDGFRPSGIRLTYAWGTRLPVGSMYRLWEEETVFILGGAEEAGKKIVTARQLSRDFQAAYGRPPKGPVTKVLIEARMPPEAKTPVQTSITVRFPAD
ncbi:MAG: hypothetical protein H6Q84_74 [Deltaproteobacteria bacterium]|nr:hypothetical protein [Deltaproteobacteria bacterium]